MVKILVPIDSEEDRSPNQKFGSSPYFMLVNTENRDEDRVVKNESMKFGGDIKPIFFIMNLEPDIVFTRHACNNAIDHMSKASITPFFVEEKPIDQLITLHQENKLPVMTEGNH